MCNCLHVDDDEMSRAVVGSVLTKYPHEQITVDQCSSMRECIRKVKDCSNYDAVLLDLYLPDTQGVATLDKMKELCLDIPIIIISCSDSLTEQRECIRRGANLFVPKDAIKVVPTMVLMAVEMHSLKRQSRAKEEALEKVRQAERTRFAYEYSKKIDYKNMALLDKVNGLLCELGSTYCDG